MLFIQSFYRPVQMFLHPEAKEVKIIISHGIFCRVSHLIVVRLLGACCDLLFRTGLYTRLSGFRNLSQPVCTGLCFISLLIY